MSYSSTVSVMTEEQRAHLRRRLEQERKRVVDRLARLSRELADIQDALKLLDETPDRYGLDERTGEPIPFDHLERVPWARTVQPHEEATDSLAVDADVLSAYRNERYAG